MPKSALQASPQKLQSHSLFEFCLIKHPCICHGIKMYSNEKHQLPSKYQNFSVEQPRYSFAKSNQVPNLHI